MRPKAKLYSFPETTKAQRLFERANIVAKNFRNEKIGAGLMSYMAGEIYQTFAECEADWLEMMILAKAHELDGYLQMYLQQIEGDDE